MPSSMTHTYFGLDVYEGLNQNCQDKIKKEKEYFKLFSQGSDPFMFYHFLVGKKTQAIRDIQKRMHQTKTQEFFLSIINYIHQNKLFNQDEVMAYLYGYICHYCLDSCTHPFIHYKAGVFKVDDKNTYRYNGRHQELEYAIDLYFIAKREKIPAYRFRVHQNIFNVKGFTLELKKIIDKTIGMVYSVDKASVYYEDSVWYMKKFFRWVNYDPYGIKLLVYQFVDRLTTDNVIRIRELSFYNQYPDISDILNLERKKWYYPWDKKIVNYSSFLDLYDKAKDIAIKIIEEVTKMLDCNQELDRKRLKKLFANLSFSTGISCDKEIELKYFEF